MRAVAVRLAALTARRRRGVLQRHSIPATPSMPSSRTLVVALLAPIALACRPAPAPATDGVPSSSVVAARDSTADSLVLERIAGFTRTPGYRVTVARSGRVAFAWLAPGDSARPATDSIPAARAAELLAAARAAGGGTLPETIREHPDLCGPMATDHGTAVVTLFYPGRGVARVSDYLGCREAVPALRAYEARIDSVAGTARWTARE